MQLIAPHLQKMYEFTSSDELVPLSVSAEEMIESNGKKIIEKIQDADGGPPAVERHLAGL